MPEVEQEPFSAAQIIRTAEPPVVDVHPQETIHVSGRVCGPQAFGNPLLQVSPRLVNHSRVDLDLSEVFVLGGVVPVPGLVNTKAVPKTKFLCNLLIATSLACSMSPAQSTWRNPTGETLL